MRISDWSSDVCSSDLMVMPTPGQIILSATIVFLALVGSAGQDAKKARLMGDAWRGWAARTSFVPYARQVAGRAPWSDTLPRGHALFGGIVFWIVATWAHGALGYMVDRKSTRLNSSH